jgi:hypothetical protein
MSPELGWPLIGRTSNDPAVRLVVAFKIEDTNEAGETTGKAYLLDLDEPGPRIITEDQKIGWTTLTDAEAFAKNMGYEFDLA